VKKRSDMRWGKGGEGRRRGSKTGDRGEEGRRGTIIEEMRGEKVRREGEDEREGEDCSRKVRCGGQERRDTRGGSREAVES
jgi:hypothetical protein